MVSGGGGGGSMLARSLSTVERAVPPPHERPSPATAARARAVSGRFIPNLTTLHLMNHGKELHQIVLLRLAPGQTFADFQKMDMNAPPPPDLQVIGGPNPAAPGGEAEATVDLKPGQYVLLCAIPSPDGKPH